MVIYNLSSSALEKIASYRTATAPVDISVHKTQIAVADLMKSVSILSYESGPPKRLTEIARHYQTSWATAVAHIGEDMFLESDAEGNITLLKRNESGVTEDDQRRLEVISSFRLGQMVNRIRTFDAPISENSVIIPAAFLGTVSSSLLFPFSPFLFLFYFFGLLKKPRPLLTHSTRSKDPSTSSQPSPHHTSLCSSNFKKR